MKKQKIQKRLTKYVIYSFLLALSIQCQNKDTSPEWETIKADLDFSQRRVEEVNEPGYYSWPITQGNESEKTFGDVTIKLKGEFTSSWYKTGVQAPFYARLISDGLEAKQKLEFIITGLQEGRHSLLTFHNTFDNLENNTLAPINIYVNEELVDTIEPSNRAEATINSAMAYFRFDAVAGKETNIRFEIQPNSKASNQRLIINGFELDGPNMKMQARSPEPENADEHVVMDDNFKLKWDSPKGTISNHFYFGENKAEIARADKDSPEYKGELEVNEFNVKDLYSMKTYYWRVDQVDANGEETHGDIWSFRPAQLAFPGAEGYGRFALGGRGGKVVEVTNLNDKGPGSLRDAVNQEIGPRTIVFNISGNIELESRLVVNQPYITIAGQTAPGKGITISRAPVGLTGDDGVIRFLRVRIGAGRTYDGMGLTGANHSIIDHSSISWTIDEGFSSRGAHNITLQRTLISEALNIANHGKYEKGKMHGYAATIGGDIGSFHHNLLAHNYGRNWSLGGGLNGNGFYAGRLDIRNNVVYNWGHRSTDGGAKEVNFVNNYYKPGPATDFFYAVKAQHEGVGRGRQQFYFEGNVMPGYFDQKNQEKGRTTTTSNNEKVDYDTYVDQPFFPSHINTQSAEQAYKSVLSDVGVNQPYLDKHDQRMIQETLDSTYTYKGSKNGLAGMIDTQEDVGGWENYAGEKRPANWDTDHDGLPNWWEDAKGLNANSPEGEFSDSNLDQNKDGFTELDDYLDWMSKPHYFLKSGETLSLSAEELFRGYTNEPSYKISDINDGEADIENSKVHYKPGKNGLTFFSVEVQDAEGDSMTRKINVYVQ